MCICEWLLYFTWMTPHMIENKPQAGNKDDWRELVEGEGPRHREWTIHRQAVQVSQPRLLLLLLAGKMELVRSRGCPPPPKGEISWQGVARLFSVFISDGHDYSGHAAARPVYKSSKWKCDFQTTSNSTKDIFYIYLSEYYLNFQIKTVPELSNERYLNFQIKTVPELSKKTVPELSNKDRTWTFKWEVPVNNMVLCCLSDFNVKIYDDVNIMMKTWCYWPWPPLPSQSQTDWCKPPGQRFPPVSEKVCWCWWTCMHLELSGRPEIRVGRTKKPPLFTKAMMIVWS